jgi:hypothetical protein
VRHEAQNLPLFSGFGDYLGLSLNRYTGDRNIFATYGEVLLPVTRRLELGGALRYDHYSDAGSACRRRWARSSRRCRTWRCAAPMQKASARLRPRKTARNRSLPSVARR